MVVNWFDESLLKYYYFGNGAANCGAALVRLILGLFELDPYIEVSSRFSDFP